MEHMGAVPLAGTVLLALAIESFVFAVAGFVVESRLAQLTVVLTMTVVVGLTLVRIVRRAHRDNAITRTLVWILTLVVSVGGLIFGQMLYLAFGGKV
jgi:hypothetical protein